MSADKAARLAAIRAANSTKAAAEPEQPSRAAESAPLTSGAPAPKPAPVPTAPAESSLLSLQLRIVLGLLFVVVSGLLIRTALEIWQPLVRGSLPAAPPNTYLSLSRSSALVGYVLLWMSMAFGLAISSKATRIWPGGPVAFDLHQHLSVLGLIFVLFHAVILVGDPLLNFTLVKALVPFVPNGYRPMWVGNLGKAALYLMLIVTLSHWARAAIGPRWWRRIHYASFAVYILSLLHGIFAGSDSGTIWAQSLYGFSGLSLVGLTIYRIRRSRTRAAPAAAGMRVGALRFDPIARIVSLADGRKVELRITEANLLYYLLQHAGRPLTPEQILAGVWGPGYKGASRLVDGYIRRLRARIEPDASRPNYIRSLDGGCYQLDGNAPHLLAEGGDQLGRAQLSA